MASPQTENGYTQIAHELVEALARTELSPNESRILWVIIRKTYGWKKKSDQISLSNFQDLTGLWRGSVCRSLESLKSRNIIKVSRSGTCKINTYEIQKNYDLWMSPELSTGGLADETSASLADETLLVSPVRPKLVSPHAESGVSPVRPTKENKDNKDSGFFGESYPQAVENQIVDLRNVGWSDPRIKDHFLMRNIPQEIIDQAFKNITEREAQNA